MESHVSVALRARAPLQGHAHLHLLSLLRGKVACSLLELVLSTTRTIFLLHSPQFGSRAVQAEPTRIMVLIVRGRVLSSPVEGPLTACGPGVG